MASYHFSVQVISRAGGRSSVAAAAYRAGSRIVDERTGAVHDYTAKRGVLDSGIELPESAPERWLDRSTLWNEVEQAERGAKAQLCRETVCAVPHELTREQQVDFAREAVRALYTSRGMVADWALHDAGADGHNVHLHVMTPMRSCDGAGFLAKSVNVYTVRSPDGDERKADAAEFRALKAEGWEKVYRYRLGGERRELTPTQARAWEGCERVGKAPVQESRYLNDWNDKGNVEVWRKEFEEVQNRALERAGSPERVDCRSYAERGIERVPTAHEGPAVREIERREQAAARAEGRPYAPVTAVRAANAEAERRNAWIERAEREIGRLREQIGRLKEELSQAARRVAERAQQLIDRTRAQEQPTAADAIGSWERAVQAEQAAASRLADLEARRPEDPGEAAGYDRSQAAEAEAERGRASAELAEARAALSGAQARLDDMLRHPLLNRGRIPDQEAAVAALRERVPSLESEISRLAQSAEWHRAEAAGLEAGARPAWDAWESGMSQARADLDQARAQTAERYGEACAVLDRMPAAQAMEALAERWVAEVGKPDELRACTDLTERQAERAAREIADPAERHAALHAAARRLDQGGWRDQAAAERVDALARDALRKVPAAEQHQARARADAEAERDTARHDAQFERVYGGQQQAFAREAERTR